jgi:hypothetical protein
LVNAGLQFFSKNYYRLKYTTAAVLAAHAFNIFTPPRGLIAFFILQPLQQQVGGSCLALDPNAIATVFLMFVVRVLRHALSTLATVVAGETHLSTSSALVVGQLAGARGAVAVAASVLDLAAVQAVWCWFFAHALSFSI